MTKLPPELGMKLFMEMPGLSSLYLAGQALDAGRTAEALGLLERAVADAPHHMKDQVRDLAAPLIGRCQALMSGRPEAESEAASCCLCGGAASASPSAAVSALVICQSCSPICRARIDELRTSGRLASERFPPARPVRALCSFCGIGPSLKPTYCDSELRELCGDCLEDFGEVVQQG